MSCEEYDQIIRTPSKGDNARRMALQALIKDGCLASLYNHAQASSRMDWIRNYSLLALTKFATINTISDEVAITLQNDEISLNIDLDRNQLKKKAANLLFLFLTIPKKPRKYKKIALMGLIAGGYWDYCDELERDPEIEEWIKKSIQAAKKVKK